MEVNTIRTETGAKLICFPHRCTAFNDESLKIHNSQMQASKENWRVILKTDS